MLLDEFKDTLTMMSRSQMAIYPVDALGLRTDPMNDPENNGGFSTSATSSSPSDTINSSHDAFNGEVSNAYGEMKSIAEVTGGKLYFGTNDLAGAVQNVIDLRRELLHRHLCANQSRAKRLLPQDQS